MNTTSEIIITDTNIITDLNNANILDKLIMLNNVYICDVVKSDEINEKTGDLKLIDKISEIETTQDQIKEIYEISKMTKGLSEYDILNFIIARDNDAILATGDQKLKIFSEENGVQVIRTLKIIELLFNKSLINNEEVINACILLKNNKYTRIPIDEIDNLIDKMK